MRVPENEERYSAVGPRSFRKRKSARMAVLRSFRQCQNGPSGEQWVLLRDGNAAIAHNLSRRCAEMLISLRRDGCFCAEKRFRLCAKNVPAMRKAATFCAQRRSRTCARAEMLVRKAFSGTFLHRDERCGEVCRMSAESLICFPFSLKGWGDKGVWPGEVSE